MESENLNAKTPIYLTPKEVANFLKCDLKTVFNWRKSGKLIAYGIGARVFYKLDEIIQALKKL